MRIGIEDGALPLKTRQARMARIEERCRLLLSSLDEGAHPYPSSPADQAALNAYLTGPVVGCTERERERKIFSPPTLMSHRRRPPRPYSRRRP